MANCEICGKGTTVGRNISITRSQVSRRWKRKVKPNLKKIRVKDENGETKRITACVRCIKNRKVNA